MAYIKCRYVAPGCKVAGNGLARSPEPYYDEWCRYNDECPQFITDIDSKKKGLCRYFKERVFEFETTVKNYEYCDDFDHWGCLDYQQPGLKVKGLFIDYTDIRYLEIDGRVLVGKKETQEV